MMLPLASLQLLLEAAATTDGRKRCGISATAATAAATGHECGAQATLPPFSVLVRGAAVPSAHAFELPPLLVSDDDSNSSNSSSSSRGNHHNSHGQHSPRTTSSASRKRSLEVALTDDVREFIAENFSQRSAATTTTTADSRREERCASPPHCYDSPLLSSSNGLGSSPSTSPRAYAGTTPPHSPTAAKRARHFGASHLDNNSSGSNSGSSSSSSSSVGKNTFECPHEKCKHGQYGERAQLASVSSLHRHVIEREWHQECSKQCGKCQYYGSRMKPPKERGNLGCRHTNCLKRFRNGNARINHELYDSHDTAKCGANCERCIEKQSNEERRANRKIFPPPSPLATATAQLHAGGPSSKKLLLTPPTPTVAPQTAATLKDARLHEMTRNSFVPLQCFPYGSSFLLTRTEESAVESLETTLTKRRMQLAEIII